MDKELKRHYTLLVDFLGHVMGPDYEIALHELKDDSNEIIAIANGELTGRHLGSPLSNKMLEYLAGNLSETQNYVLDFETVSATGKTMCSSSMLIRGRSGELTGFLCINFDASRYEELARKVMELCGGGLQRGVHSGTRLIADSNDPVEMPVRSGYPTSIAGATASIVSQVVADYPVEVDRLTQDEKMEIRDILNRKGVFLLKGSVSHVAQALHSSEASIYRYLGKLNNK